MAAKKHPLGWYPIHTAVLSGDLEIISLILEQPGVSPNVVDEYKFSKDRPDIQLTRRRSEFSSRIDEFENTLGATALHLACLRGDWSIIRALLIHGALFEPEDGTGRLPADYFEHGTNPKVAEVVKLYNSYLSKFVSSPREKGKYLDTPLPRLQ